jgi:hypothetical protein
MSTLHEDQYKFLTIFGQFFVKLERFQKNVVLIKTHILGSITFFYENRAVYEVMWKKNCRSGQTRDENMAHAHCMLYT